MRKSSFKKALLTLLVILSTTGVKAALAQWEIVPSESTLRFTATQNNAPASGEFKKFSGKISVDPENYKASSIDIIVDMTSLSASYSDLKDTGLTKNPWNR